MRVRYGPFRLVCTGGGEVLEIAPAASIYRRAAIDSPIMFTSSGLGDERVEGPRQALFADLVGSAGGADGADVDERLGDPRSRQDRFHAHRWSEAPQLSVFMARADACTVSRTVVEIGEERVTLTYFAPPDWAAGVRESLPRQRAASSR